MSLTRMMASRRRAWAGDQRSRRLLPGSRELPPILIAAAAGGFLHGIVGLAILKFRVVEAPLEGIVRARAGGFVEGRFLPHW